MIGEAKIYQVNNINLHVMEAGRPEDKIIMFLHGFPEFWYGWRKQITYFASMGFRVIVPDQRGYNQSSKPTGIKAYTLEKLTGDVAALIRQVTSQKIYLVGHDWGGAVAWAMAQHYPELLDKLIILNMPHPGVMARHLRKNPRQMLKSWYAGFFQLSFLPELMCRAFNYKILAQSMIRTANKDTFAIEDLATYRKAWEKPRALTAMLNWYRAFKYNPLILSADVKIPTLLIWGKKDAFLDYEMATDSMKKCLHGQIEILPDATHWLHHEKPDEVNKLIFNFIA